MDINELTTQQKSTLLLGLAGRPAGPNLYTGECPPYWGMLHWAWENLSPDIYYVKGDWLRQPRGERLDTILELAIERKMIATAANE